MCVKPPRIAFAISLPLRPDAAIHALVLRAEFLKKT